MSQKSNSKREKWTLNRVEDDFRLDQLVKATNVDVVLNMVREKSDIYVEVRVT